MCQREPSPPRAALWLLRHFCPGNNEPLAGDLIERFREGETRVWFWKQVLSAFASGCLCELRRQWPRVAYVAAGLAAPFIFRNDVRLAREVFLSWDLSWPWSQIGDVGPLVLIALTAVPVLAIALAWKHEFRIRTVLRTGAINVALVLSGHYAMFYLVQGLASLGIQPGHSRPHLLFAIEVLEMLWFASVFVISAWLGADRAPSHPCDAPLAPAPPAG